MDRTSTKETDDTEHVAIEIIDSMDSSDPDVQVKVQNPASSPMTKDDPNFDDGLLNRAVEDAGRWAFGTVLAEIWVWNDDHTALFRPDAGWWVDPAFRNSDPDISRLTDPKRPDFVPSKPVAAGVGLPGVLWMEKARGNRIVWREVKAIANDPDQPYNPRLQILGSMGLGWAAAVGFERLGYSGLVIYMARQGVDFKRLQGESNEEYILAASDFAAAAYVLRGPRQRAMSERKSELTDVVRRARNRILALTRLGVNIETLVNDNSGGNAAAAQTHPLAGSFTAKHCMSHFKHRITTTLHKSRGSNVQPPPSMGWEQSLFTFCGSFVTLLALTRLNVLINEELGSDYTLILPLFGSVVTMFYGLAAAPASQPRNVILGQGISMVIAIVIGFADKWTNWFRQSLATSLSIAAMVKCGVTHPPAGSVALLFSTGQYGWGNLLFIMIGNVIAILVATIINNWSEARQFPSYWGIGNLIKACTAVTRKVKVEDSEHAPVAGK